MKPRDFEVSRVARGVYLLDFRSRYLAAMHFVRFQERYESANPWVRGKHFELLDYMEWYASEHGGAFTYPADWSGFNVPGHVFESVFLDDRYWEDCTRYDEAMRDATSEMVAESGRYYVLGVTGKEGSTYRHELAHGYFYTRPDYRKAATKLVREMPENLRESFASVLAEMGYGPNVRIDEAQAYMATGLPTKLSKAFAAALEANRAPFVALYGATRVRAERELASEKRL